LPSPQVQPPKPRIDAIKIDIPIIFVFIIMPHLKKLLKTLKFL